MNWLRIMDEISYDNSTLGNVCACIGWGLGFIMWGFAIYVMFFM